MHGPPPDLITSTADQPRNNTGADSFSALPGSEMGDASGNPDAWWNFPEENQPGQTDIPETGDGLTSLDIEKHPCNADDDVDDDRLPDEYLPPPEWQVPPISREESKFWHSSHQRERKAVYEAYHSMGRHRPLHRFVNCGSDVRVFVRRRIGDEFQVRVASCRCRDRFCPLCARCRSTILASNVATLIRERKCTVRLITLTLRHSDTPLKDQLARLTSSFNNLKRRAWWKARVVGGVMFTEIKIGRDNRWHVHCHIIAEGEYLANADLSREWHAVTGDSPVVDVRAVRDVETAAGYIAKYGSKPCDRSVIFQRSRLTEAIAAMKGTRTCTTFGEWRGKKLSACDEDTDNVGWFQIGTLNSVRDSEWWPVVVALRPDIAKRIEECVRNPKTSSG